MRKPQKYKNITFIIVCAIITMFLLAVPYELITTLNNDTLLTQEELKILDDKNFGVINTKTMLVVAQDEEKEKAINDYTVKFKLFNLFNIKNLKVKVSNSNQLHVGGNCIGISLKSKGVVIVGSNYIITKEGNINPYKESNLQVGDVLLKINDTDINTVEDITQILNTYTNKEPLKLLISRKNEEKIINIIPAKDVQTQRYKLGLWIRDDALGVGTITFVDNETKRFGALGHAIIDADTVVKFSVINGEIYKCNVIGIKAGKKGAPGELMGLFMKNSQPIGSVDKNSSNGIYGYINDKDYLANMKLYEVGGKMTAKPGKAKIMTCINVLDIEEYDI